ncbi:MAG: 5-oxoprolinase subunit PxpB [Phycisphaeraceae bacterium]|nr:MAG: 5-oxoprolinase subunit PxpB [Phycisphaeraceae bacterium]
MTPTPRGDTAREASIRRVHELASAIGEAGLPWVEDVIPSVRGVLVIIDPLKAGRDVVASLTVCARDADTRAGAGGLPCREIVIPVCYDARCAPDLEAVAAAIGRSTSDVIAMHAGAVYIVECLGFSPGFGYLWGLPEALHLPRRDSPRPRVPAGSVAIAGEHTAVYPQATPGGWHLIGRSPQKLFDQTFDRPALLAVGDTVRFEPISYDKFVRSINAPGAAGDR